MLSVRKVKALALERVALIRFRRATALGSIPAGSAAFSEPAIKSKQSEWSGKFFIDYLR